MGAYLGHSVKVKRVTELIFNFNRLLFLFFIFLAIIFHPFLALNLGLLFSFRCPREWFSG